MKNLLLKSILLVSHREKKARKIDFHPQVTIIKGQNDTGKSSLIKSIYFAFGANPHSRHHKWKNADTSILLRFTVDNDSFSIYRHRDSFSLFDSENELIGTYSSVTNELAPALAKIFNFNLKLTDRDGHSSTPPPAFLFLPFYIDQDKGWVSTWSSFTNLGQFSNWKKRVINYHLGLKPDKWYELEANKKSLESDQDEPRRQISSINSIAEKTKNNISNIDFDIDIEEFKSEIEKLLDQCNILKKYEENYRTKTTELKTEKIRLEAQIEIVTKTHDELSEDYKYATQESDDHIGCPTCGAEYNNSFTERFDIAKDTETCSDLLASLRDDINSINKKIIETENDLFNAKDRQIEINELLSRKQGDIKLNDLIKLEGKKSLLKNLTHESKLQQNILNKLSEEIEKISEKMSGFDTPEIRKKIIENYSENLRRSASKLQVTSLDERIYKNVYSNIDESGSDLPRAILAYNFSILKIIEQNNDATFCPIIIDAPNQQEQDEENLKKILRFISNNRPSQHQLILGLVDNSDIDFGGKVIELHKKYSLLEEEQYQSTSQEIRYFESKNLELT